MCLHCVVSIVEEDLDDLQHDSGCTVRSVQVNPGRWEADGEDSTGGVFDGIMKNCEM